MPQPNGRTGGHGQEAFHVDGSRPVRAEKFKEKVGFTHAAVVTKGRLKKVKAMPKGVPGVKVKIVPMLNLQSLLDSSPSWNLLPTEAPQSSA